MSLAIATYGENSRLAAPYFMILGTSQYRDGDASCIDVFRKLHNVYEAAEDKEPKELEMSTYWRALGCRAYGDLPQARKLLESLIRQLREAAVPDEDGIACFTMALAGIDACEGRREAALARYREAIDLRATLVGSGDDRLQQWRQELADYEAGKLPSLAAEDWPIRYDISPPD